MIKFLGRSVNIVILFIILLFLFIVTSVKFYADSYSKLTAVYSCKRYIPSNFYLTEKNFNDFIEKKHIPLKMRNDSYVLFSENNKKRLIESRILLPRTKGDLITEESISKNARLPAKYLLDMVFSSYKGEDILTAVVIQLKNPYIFRSLSVGDRIEILIIEFDKKIKRYRNIPIIDLIYKNNLPDKAVVVLTHKAAENYFLDRGKREEILVLPTGVLNLKEVKDENDMRDIR